MSRLCFERADLRRWGAPPTLGELSVSASFPSGARPRQEWSRRRCRARYDDQTLNRSIAEIDSLSTLAKCRQNWADIARAWLSGQTREHAELAARWEWLDGFDETMCRRRELLDNCKGLAA